MRNSRRERLDAVLRDISALAEHGNAFVAEELCLTKRDPMSRIERRVREKGTPLTNTLLRARRERRARDREHSQKGVLAAPTKHLSTRLRIR